MHLVQLEYWWECLSTSQPLCCSKYCNNAAHQMNVTSQVQVALHCIALERGFEWQYRPIRGRTDVALAALLLLHRTIPCANYFEQCEHFPQIDCIIRSLPWRHCRIPAGIPGSVTPSRALCPPRSPRSQAFRPTRSGHGSHQTQITP